MDLSHNKKTTKANKFNLQVHVLNMKFVYIFML